MVLWMKEMRRRKLWACNYDDDELNTNPATRSRFASAHQHQNPKENLPATWPATRESQVEGIWACNYMHNYTATSETMGGKIFLYDGVCGVMVY